MHSLQELGPRIIVSFGDKLFLTESVIWTWIVMVFLVVISLLITRNLKIHPGKIQAIVEYYVESIYHLVDDAVGRKNTIFAPYFTSLLLFLVCGNMLGIIGIRSSTADVNTTFAVAIISFIMIQGYAIKTRGFGGHIHHMAQPMKFLLPINMISELMFPISLAFRLFGNILGGCIIMALCYSATATLSHAVGFGFPVFSFGLPIFLNLFFDLFEPVLQAFVFSILTMTFIGINSTVEEA